ncbi:MAG: hypothetical protein HY094_03260 [Candidatus Melainabacteria bacterium]|nr:hypothetical protein [Candidatus Melainabacteria bacterium]
MSTTELSNNIDCLNLTADEINFQIKNLMFNNFKNAILKNVYGKNGLLEGLKGNIKIEIIGDVSSDFGNNINGPKIVVNGDINNNSACNVKSGKFTVYGSCINCFGNDAKAGEFYILENCGKNSFLNLGSSSKVVIGGFVNSGFAFDNNGGTIIVLNLKGGNIYIEDDWFKDYKSGHIYFRGEKEKINAASHRFLIENVTAADEDIYLPLISEFARLFNYSLDEIKSKPFNRILMRF